MVVLGTLTAANAQRNNYCLLDDLAADILDADAVSGTISNVPGPCADSTAYSAFSAGSSLFFNQLKNRLGGAYCFGSLVNRSPGAPDPGSPVVTFYRDGTVEIGSLTVTSTSIIYTIDSSTVIFLIPDRVGFNFFQLCTNGTTITLYDECGALDSQPFFHNAFGDNDAAGLLRNLFAPPGELGFQVIMCISAVTVLHTSLFDAGISFTTVLSPLCWSKCQGRGCG